MVQQQKKPKAKPKRVPREPRPKDAPLLERIIALSALVSPEESERIPADLSANLHVYARSAKRL